LEGPACAGSGKHAGRAWEARGSGSDESRGSGLELWFTNLAATDDDDYYDDEYDDDDCDDVCSGLGSNPAARLGSAAPEPDPVPVPVIVPLRLTCLQSTVVNMSCHGATGCNSRSILRPYLQGNHREQLRMPTLSHL